MLEIGHDQRMKTITKLDQLSTIKAIKNFLESTQTVVFTVATCKTERYLWAQKTLVKHDYMALSKLDKGLMTRYLMKVTSYSRAQTKRLIRQYVETGIVRVHCAKGNGFQRPYTAQEAWVSATISPVG